MSSDTYNVWAIVVAAAVSMAVGMGWYAPPVLGRRWQQHTGITQPGRQAMVIWAVCYLVLAFTLAYLFRHLGVSGLGAGLRWGTTVGGAVCVLAIAPNYAFGRRPLALFLIEAGYVFVAVSVMGAVLGAWR